MTAGVRFPYSPGMVTDTGKTVRQVRNGVWVDIPVLIRNGHTCICGDLHGRFPRCIGSAAGSTPAPRRRRRQRSFREKMAQEMFPLPKRRLPRAIDQAVINACDGCGPFNDAFYYCVEHRSQAVRNVLLAGRKNPGIISLHLAIADRGYDIAS